MHLQSLMAHLVYGPTTEMGRRVVRHQLNQAVPNGLPNMVNAWTGDIVMLLRTVLAGMLLVLITWQSRAARAPQHSAARTAPCRAEGTLSRLPELPEASGVAVSRSIPDRLWAHTDSGEARLFALDTHGTVTGRVRVTGATVVDWEAIAVGPCPAGSCLYVADIGDNDAKRRHVTVYLIPEPAGANGTAAVSGSFEAIYPDGAQDAEALLVTSDGGLFVVTKGTTGPVALYRFPRDLQSAASLRLERVGKPREDGKPDGDQRITDGTVSPDGQWVVLRTQRALVFYRAPQFFTGNWQQDRLVDIHEVGEPQGEGVALGLDGTIYLAGEGGGDARPGSFARLRCLFDRWTLISGPATLQHSPMLRDESCDDEWVADRPSRLLGTDRDA
jgi:hypothetical protein